MKRRELLKLFAKAGWYLKRNGSQHDIYTNGVDSEAVPSHPDINERLAKALIKKWGSLMALLFKGFTEVLIMKSVAYPIILEKEADGYFVTVPDIDRYTQGEDIADAMEMARDLICLWLLDLEESGKSIPQPASMELNVSKDAIVTFVDVNLDEYRKKYGTRVVKKNCTIPAWLNARAEAIGVNFSQTLQEALLAKIEAC